MKSYPVTKLPPTKYMGNVVFRLPKAIECCNSIASISASMKSNVEHSAADGAKPRRGRRRSDKPALAAVATTSLSSAADAEPSDADTVTESSESTSAPTRGSGGLPPARPLGELLLERKLVTTEQLTQAMDRQKRTRRRLGRVLVEMGFATAEGVLDALSAQLGVNSTRVNSYTVNPEAVQCLPERVARKHMAFPLLKVGSRLVVAIASPKKPACARRSPVRLGLRRANDGRTGDRDPGWALQVLRQYVRGRRGRRHGGRGHRYSWAPARPARRSGRAIGDLTRRPRDRPGGSRPGQLCAPRTDEEQPPGPVADRRHVS